MAGVTIRPEDHCGGGMTNPSSLQPHFDDLNPIPTHECGDEGLPSIGIEQPQACSTFPKEVTLAEEAAMEKPKVPCCQQEAYYSGAALPMTSSKSILTRSKKGCNQQQQQQQQKID